MSAYNPPVLSSEPLTSAKSKRDMSGAGEGEPSLLLKLVWPQDYQSEDGSDFHPPALPPPSSVVAQVRKGATSPLLFITVHSMRFNVLTHVSSFSL